MPEVFAKARLLTHTAEPLSVIYAALRQCYHAGFVGDMWERLRAGEIDRSTQAALVAKILASGHDSPMEHVSFTFALEGISRACSHQLVRHRIASYSQQSQRYVDAGYFNYILPPAIARNRAAAARYAAFMETCAQAYRDIKDLLETDGRAKKAAEDARFVLPQAAETRIVLSMNCRALHNFFAHRCCMRAQWEIRHVAEQMLAQCRAVLPEVFTTAGAPCEGTRLCPEAPDFACGRYPTQAGCVENP